MTPSVLLREAVQRKESASLPAADLCLVSCGRRKVRSTVPAKDLYISDWFQKTRRLIEREGWPWFILSAKHGLLDPERKTEWYDMTLKNMDAGARRDWARAVLVSLEPHLAGVQSIVIFAGALYRKHLEPALRSRGIEVHVRSLRQGEQLAWLNAQLARPKKPRGK